MKQHGAKITLALLVLLGLFIALTYWSVSSTEETFDTCDLVGIEDPDKVDFKKYKTVRLAASTLYKGNPVKNLMQGEQYREAWATPITAPVVFLDTLYGGVEVIEEGGGKQTHSLELEDPNGIRLTLRSITKDPDPLIPDFVKTLGLENIVVDGISAQHPYAAIVAAALAEHAGIMHTHPKIVFVPKQDRLGKYNEKYGNRLFLLEYESEGKVDWTGIEDVIEIMDTDDLQKLKQEHPEDVAIDIPLFVRARLFDLIIGDWDRHAKQWGWVVQKKQGKHLAFPLAGDRDNAFFSIDGVLPAVITNKEFLPKVQSLDDTIDFLPGLVLKVDRYFLINVPEEVFTEQATVLQDKLSNTVIKEAFQLWPESIRELNAAEIIQNLISRRDDIQEYAKEFKRLIDEKGYLEEPLVGSEDKELEPWVFKCFECRE